MLEQRQVDQLAKRAVFLHSNRSLFPYIENMDVEDIFDLLVHAENDKIARDQLTDQLIDFNDEIVEIVELGVQESLDISVTGDNLFYANGILTKNSFGLPATADIMFALISSEELQDLNQMMVKQLKNRYSDPSINRKFVIGVDRARMKLYDVEQHAQNDIIDDTPSFDSTPTGKFGKNTFKDFH